MTLRAAVDTLVDKERDIIHAEWREDEGYMPHPTVPVLEQERDAARAEVDRLLGALEVLPDTILTWEGLKTNWINGHHAGVLDRTQQEAARADVIAASKILTDTLKDLGCKGVP